MEYTFAILRKILENQEISMNNNDYEDNENDTIADRIYKLRKRNKMSRNTFAKK